MERAVGPLREIVALNTDLLLNCLDGLSDGDAAARPVARGNSMAFLAAHLVDARHVMTRLLGQAVASPLEPVLGHVTHIDEATTMPTLVELRRWWQNVAGHLGRCLEHASPDVLAAPAPQRFPVADATVLGAVAFLIQHESYHLGQMSLLRRGLGFAPMTYARGTGERR